MSIVGKHEDNGRSYPSRVVHQSRVDHLVVLGMHQNSAEHHIDPEDLGDNLVRVQPS